MYIIRAYSEDKRDEATRRKDWTCYKEYKEEVLFDICGIPITRKVGVEGTFEDKHIIEYKSEFRDDKYKWKLFKLKLFEKIVEEAYIPNSKLEFKTLKKVVRDMEKGKYGPYKDREVNLRNAGYDYFKILSIIGYQTNWYKLFTKKDWEEVANGKDKSN